MNTKPMRDEMDTLDADEERRKEENLGFGSHEKLGKEHREHFVSIKTKHTLEAGFGDYKVPAPAMIVIEKFAKKSAEANVDWYEEEMKKAKEVEDPLDALDDQLNALAGLFANYEEAAARQLARATENLYSHAEHAEEPFVILKQGEEQDRHDYVSDDTIQFVINQLGLEMDREEVDPESGDIVTFYKPVGDSYVFIRHDSCIKKPKNDGETGRYVTGLGVQLKKA